MSLHQFVGKQNELMQINTKQTKRTTKESANLPEEEALNALIGARSGFCITRNVR